MTTFYALLSATFVFDAILLFFLAWAFHSERFGRYRIREIVKMKVTPRSRIQNMVVSSVLSLIVIYGATYALFDHLFTTAETPLWMMGLQTVGVLLVYDFAYYFLHRAMHIKKVMRFCHGVHHRARFPSALESFYLHPIELLAGIALLLVTTFALGPVHVYAFGAIFFVYSTLNILVHMGLRFPSRLMAPINELARKHHVHHMDDFGKNYSSLTPLPDKLFGTSG